MKYYIKIRAAVRQKTLEISEGEADLLAKAAKSLTAALALEETYDLVLENYIEMEKDLFSFNINEVVKIQHDYQDHFEIRSTLNRRFVNLLTATRLYLDQAQQHLSHCCDDRNSACEIFDKRTKHHYDGVFGYRFMSALRNHVQHCGSAVHAVELFKANRYISGERFIENTVTPMALKTALMKDFKAAIRDEMKDQVDLTEAAREYVTCIGDLHSLARKEYQNNVKKSRTSIEDALDRFSKLNTSQKILLVAVVNITKDADNKNHENVIANLLLDWEDVREKLEKKNFAGANLSSNLIVNKKLTGIPTRKH